MSALIHASANDSILHNHLGCIFLEDPQNDATGILRDNTGPVDCNAGVAVKLHSNRCSIFFAMANAPAAYLNQPLIIYSLSNRDKPRTPSYIAIRH